jgi:two-component system chemotaxis response regulator CheB
MNVLLAERPAVAPTTPVRVMVVDDSVVVRGLVARWVDEEPGLQTVAALRTGREAVDQFERFDPDVVILDIEMPDLDGLSALPLLLAKKRDLVVIMASALSRRHAEVSIKALSLGAADYVSKPLTNRDVTTSPTFRRELIEKVRQLGRRQATRRDLRKARGGGGPVAPRMRAAARSREAATERSAEISLRPFTNMRPRALLIGASTGGPQALGRIIPTLKGVLDRVPVLIVQHMPQTFTTILAEHLSRTTGRPMHEAIQGEQILPGAIYLAPGARHMSVERRFTQFFIDLDDGPPVNFCKPALDPLFASASAAWGSAVLAVILTGMGTDGTGGAEAVASAGGNVIAQDEPTSVVWGMPGSAAHAGVCAAVLPLDEIGPKITRVFAGDFS